MRFKITELSTANLTRHLIALFVLAPFLVVMFPGIGPLLILAAQVYFIAILVSFLYLVAKESIMKLPKIDTRRVWANARRVSVIGTLSMVFALASASFVALGAIGGGAKFFGFAVVSLAALGSLKVIVAIGAAIGAGFGYLLTRK